jgi:hypothetical protein
LALSIVTTNKFEKAGRLRKAGTRGRLGYNDKSDPKMALEEIFQARRQRTPIR